jgi:hypothetical protein
MGGKRGLQAPLLDAPMTSESTILLSNGSALTIGLALFMTGQVSFNILNERIWPDHWGVGGWQNMVTWVSYGLLQTTGLLVMTTADVDANAYFTYRQRLVLAFVLMWIFFNGIHGTMNRKFDGIKKHIDGYTVVDSILTQWIPMLPFLFLLLRFSRVMERRTAVVFTELFLLTLALEHICQGAKQIRQGHYYANHPDPKHLSAQRYGGAVRLAGGLFMLFHYPLSGRWRSRRRRRLVRSKTLRFYVGLYLYLLVEGMKTLVTTTLGGREPGQLIFGSLHVLLTLPMFCVQKRITRFLGRYWLRLRLKARDPDDTAIDESWGRLAEVEELIGEMGNLNGYCRRTVTDSYTMLHLACFNSHADAVQRLLKLGQDAVDVGLGSEVRGWTPLFIAARNGHVGCATLLLEHHAAVQQPTNEGQSPLIIASARGHVEIVALLLSYGASDAGRGSDGVLWMELDSIDTARAMEQSQVLDYYSRQGEDNIADSQSAVRADDEDGGAMGLEGLKGSDEGHSSDSDDGNGDRDSQVADRDSQVADQDSQVTAASGIRDEVSFDNSQSNYASSTAIRKNSGGRRSSL